MTNFDQVGALFSASPRRRARKVERSPSVVKHDRLDEGVLDDLRGKAEHFAPAFEPPEVATPTSDDPPSFEDRAYEPWEDLASDAFYAFHTYSHPSIRANEEVRPSRQLHRRVLEQVVHSDSFNPTRGATRHDDVASALATMNVLDTVRELLESELKEQAERAQEMAQQEQQAQDAMGANDGIREAVAQQGGQLTPEQREAMKQNAQARAAAEQALAANEQAQAQQGLGLDATQAIQQAASDAQEAADDASAMGIGAHAGSGQQLPADQALDLAREISSNDVIRNILRKLGRFERDMRYQRAKRITGGREEIIDVELGQDLTRALPSELVKLKHPLLRRDFMRRFYENSLMQYEMIGEANAGNGPIVCVIDGSGSMGGEKNEWARAVALAMVSIAHREKRDAACVEFDARQVKSWFFPAKQPVDPRTIIDFAGHFFGGGTDTTLGLAEAKRLIDTRPEFNKADVSIIIDGIDKLGDDDRELRDACHAQGVRLHGVAIGSPATAWQEEICDTTVSAYDLAAPSDATAQIAQQLS